MLRDVKEAKLLQDGCAEYRDAGDHIGADELSKGIGAHEVNDTDVHDDVFWRAEPCEERGYVGDESPKFEIC